MNRCYQTVSIVVFALLFVVSSALMQEPPAQAASGDCCWIDVKTGEFVPTVPLTGINLGGSAKVSGATQMDGEDPKADHAFNPKTGQHFYHQPEGCWIDTKTGESVPTVPLTGINLGGSAEVSGATQMDGEDPKADHAFNPKTGQHFVRVPCPPPPSPQQTGPIPPKPGDGPKVSSITPGWSGMYFGLNTVKNWGHTQTNERSAATGTLTNQFTDSGDPIGGGLSTGFNFAPWHNGNKGWGRLRLGPFAEFDYLNQTINHTFAGGSFIGTTTHWSATGGLKVGGIVLPGVFIYGITGVSWLNEDQNISWGGGSSSKTTIPGFTFGPGVEYQPSILQGFGLPISVYAQYQHTWWGDAHNNTPAASPAFNYTNGREDDTIKFGVNVYFH